MQTDQHAVCHGVSCQQQRTHNQQAPQTPTDGTSPVAHSFLIILQLLGPTGFDQTGRRYSLLEYVLRETEALHAKLRRFTSPDEHAFFPGAWLTVRRGGRRARDWMGL